jgi:hypothetical protein
MVSIHGVRTSMWTSEVNIAGRTELLSSKPVARNTTYPFDFASDHMIWVAFSPTYRLWEKMCPKPSVSWVGLRLFLSFKHLPRVVLTKQPLKHSNLWEQHPSCNFSSYDHIAGFLKENKNFCGPSIYNLFMFIGFQKYPFVRHALLHKCSSAMLYVSSY